MLSPNSSDQTKSTLSTSPNTNNASLLSANFEFVDRSSVISSANPAPEAAINPFTQRQVIRSRRIKRQQGSSRFINEHYKELEQLPSIKGIYLFFN